MRINALMGPLIRLISGAQSPKSPLLGLGSLRSPEPPSQAKTLKRAGRICSMETLSQERSLRRL